MNLLHILKCIQNNINCWFLPLTAANLFNTLTVFKGINSTVLCHRYFEYTLVHFFSYNFVYITKLYLHIEKISGHTGHQPVLTGVLTGPVSVSVLLSLCYFKQLIVYICALNYFEKPIPNVINSWRWCDVSVTLVPRRFWHLRRGFTLEWSRSRFGDVIHSWRDVSLRYKVKYY